MMSRMWQFVDWRDAGQKLAVALPQMKPESTVVIALPRGGVPGAEEVCKVFQVPLDLVFVRKIGVPSHPELAISAIIDGSHPRVVINHDIARHVGLWDQDVEKIGLSDVSTRGTDLRI